MIISVGSDYNKNLELLKKLKKDFKTRKSSNYQEVVMTHVKQKIIFNHNSEVSKGLCLFRMVMKDINNYIEDQGYVEPDDELPVNFTNENYKDGELIAIDLDHAYWRVAFLKEYISKNTYKKGLERNEFKTIRLSALSTLGKSIVYDVYVNGKFSHKEMEEEDEYLQDFYKDIRFTTYNVMKETGEMLGEDFHSYKTDCIYFNDTPHNREIVIKQLESYNLLWKYQNKNEGFKENRRDIAV